MEIQLQGKIISGLNHTGIGIRMEFRVSMVLKSGSLDHPRSLIFFSFPVILVYILDHEECRTKQARPRSQDNRAFGPGVGANDSIGLSGT